MMHCRNCRHEIDNEFRYCPHCGSPSSFGWQAAGGPWLRRPAVMAGFALLLIAWLAALQRQLNGTMLPATGTGHPGYSQIATRPREVDRSAGPTAVPRSAGAPGAHPWRQGRVVVSAPAQRKRAGQRRQHDRQIALAPVASPEPARPSRRRAARRRAAGPSAAPSVTGARALLATYRIPLRRPSVDRGVENFRGRQRPRPARRPWTQSPVYVRGHSPRQVQPLVPTANLVVNVSAQPYGVKTFVYLDGGRELGIAPLRVRFDRPGRHRLLFFAPTLGRRGRAYRTIVVTGQRRLWVAARLAPSREVARF